ncbi:hypothetical protein J1N35_015005 [Gossypium stocksii]|uniref:Uncharacterized protein n=1 Tax=Gossypium stocksii TaxID=47602 RepID=A0A9D3VY28_9ROSI|nr:hypothetical protein J1N35_015005 [Gossypium stocksii]
MVFPFNSSSGQVGVSGSGAQHDEADLFAGWFTDRSINFDNAVYRRAFIPLDLKLSIGQELPIPFP